MKKSFVYFALCGTALCLLTACSSADKKLEGKRIAVLQQPTEISADYTRNEVKITLPKTYMNKTWSQVGANSTHNLENLFLPAELKKAWSKDFGKGSGKRNFLISTPVVLNGVIFTVDANATVSAFRLDNAKKIWKTELEIENSDDISIKGAGIATYNKLVYVTTGTGHVFALNMKDGSKIWQYDAQTPIRIAPTINNAKLFVQTINNDLIALNTQTGKELWNYKSLSEETTLVGGAAPAYSVNNDVVVAGFSNGELRALKASTGTPLWANYLALAKRGEAMSSINTIVANPVIDNSVVYAVGHNNMSASINLKTGEKIWEKQISGTNQPWNAGKYMYILTDQNQIVTIEKQTGKIIFSNTVPTTPTNDNKKVAKLMGPVLANNRLIITSTAGYVFFVSPYNGKILNYIDVDEKLVAPAIVADGHLILVDEDAQLIVYK